MEVHLAFAFALQITTFKLQLNLVFPHKFGFPKYLVYGHPSNKESLLTVVFC